MLRHILAPAPTRPALMQLMTACLAGNGLFSQSFINCVHSAGKFLAFRTGGVSTGKNKKLFQCLSVDKPSVLSLLTSEEAW
jgi:hypothetical protein